MGTSQEVLSGSTESKEDTKDQSISFPIAPDTPVLPTVPDHEVVVGVKHTEQTEASPTPMHS